jgi:hypothetical protein
MRHVLTLCTDRVAREEFFKKKKYLAPPPSVPGKEFPLQELLKMQSMVDILFSWHCCVRDDNE